MSEITGLDRLKDFVPGKSTSKGTTFHLDEGSSGFPLVTRDRLAIGSVLAFDQSLDAFGWVSLSNTKESCRITSAGSFSTSKDYRKPGTTQPLKGHPLNLERGVEVYERVREMFRPLADNIDVVWETPPAGGKMARPESSLLSALAIKIAAKERGIVPVMLGAQTCKKLFTGNSNAEKPVAHRAMMHQVSGWMMDIDTITNEAKRDALLLAITHLVRKSEGIVL